MSDVLGFSTVKSDKLKIQKTNIINIGIDRVVLPEHVEGFKRKNFDYLFGLMEMEMDNHPFTWEFQNEISDVDKKNTVRSIIGFLNKRIRVERATMLCEIIFLKYRLYLLDAD
ncbi:MAG: hypothetical protein OQK98_05920 [Gammaproteobacteria bacterium]|nr:hypothetical protein [Gammaproteobacteria bacterium]